MQATVIRNGEYQGQSFVEVEVNAAHFSVPVDGLIPDGTLVDVLVNTVATEPVEEEAPPPQRRATKKAAPKKAAKKR